MSEKQDELRFHMLEISKSLKLKTEESISSEKFMKLKLSEYRKLFVFERRIISFEKRPKKGLARIIRVRCEHCGF